MTTKDAYVATMDSVAGIHGFPNVLSGWNGTKEGGVSEGKERIQKMR